MSTKRVPKGTASIMDLVKGCSQIHVEAQMLFLTREVKGFVNFQRKAILCCWVSNEDDTILKNMYLKNPDIIFCAPIANRRFDEKVCLQVHVNSRPTDK